MAVRRCIITTDTKFVSIEISSLAYKLIFAKSKSCNSILSLFLRLDLITLVLVTVFLILASILALKALFFILKLLESFWPANSNFSR